MKVLFAGGGTGGHLMPALAVAGALRREAPGTEIAFVGTNNGMEAEKVPAAGYAFHAVRGGQVKGVGLMRAIKGMAAAILGVIDAIRILRAFKASVVVCVGGYASFAAGTAARIMRIPVAVLEQNAIPGRVNRFLSRFADLVVVPFDETAKRLHGRKVEKLGNPVRLELIERFEKLNREEPNKGFGLFIFGGSQGARRLNEAAESYASALGEKLGTDIRVTHQAGAVNFEEVRRYYSDRGLSVDVRGFIEDMAGVYAKTSLVVCRAGATSIAELTALGLPSVLVPYPFAADDHQRANAEILKQAGASEVIEDGRMDAAALADVVERLRSDGKALAGMARAARALGRPEAASEIAGRVLAIGGLH
jgi:UDP-N-acetylglucosamine--N-acetylmuramyl-(pentapeptide) pyrophosphoryl-undecaprenol N-acetylglucosamine transferase